MILEHEREHTFVHVHTYDHEQEYENKKYFNIFVLVLLFTKTNTPKYLKILGVFVFVSYRTGPICVQISSCGWSIKLRPAHIDFYEPLQCTLRFRIRK